MVLKLGLIHLSGRRIVAAIKTSLRGWTLLKVAMAQVNPTVGDLEGNTRSIETAEVVDADFDGAIDRSSSFLEGRTNVFI